jgi:hypothetical protein
MICREIRGRSVSTQVYRTNDDDDDDDDIKEKISNVEKQNCLYA